MVGVFNTRADKAGRNAKYALLIAALSLLLIGILLSWSNRYVAQHAQYEACSGYAGQPSHEYIIATGDPAGAAAHCLTDLPLVRISVKNKHYISMQRKRLEALETNILVTDDADFVPALIRFKGRDYKAKIRLKGDWTDHVAAPSRWSLRIVLSGDGYILGRKRFSLQTLKARSYDKDPLYTMHLAAVGQLTPRYKPVKVEFNGMDWGNMVIEDHFNRELMESRRRKESVIGRFDESAMWRRRSELGEFGPYDNVYTTNYKSFNGKAIRKSPSLKAYDHYSRSIMTAWQEGRVPLADIVDLEKFADFIIASEAWSGAHTFRWHNMRFYLNPYTIKLEPIPFDNGWFLSDISESPVQAAVTGSQVLAGLFDSPEFRQVLGKRLRPLLRSLKSKSVWDDLKTNASYLHPVLQAEGVRGVLHTGLLRGNLDYLWSAGMPFFDNLAQIPPVPEQDMQLAFASQVKVSAYSNGAISLVNKLPSAVEIVDVRLASNFSSRSILGEGKPAITLPATPLRQRPQPIYLEAEPIEPGSRVLVQSRHPVSGAIVEDITEQVLSYIDTADLDSWSPLEVSATVSLPDFIVIDKKSWKVPAGSWFLRKPLVVPQGVVLRFEPGAVLTITNNSFILSRGKLDLVGTSQAPVTLRGEVEGGWNGIYLVNVQRRSLWKHAIIRDVSAFTSGNFKLSGALNFYRSPIKLDHVRIENTLAEDAINTVESHFEFSNLSVRHTASDAFDSDFSEGLITASSFENIGGDALDTSGSSIIARDLRISVVADKAISIGEASRMEVYGAKIEDVGVGIAVKDYSHAKLERVEVRGARVAAAMAYSKKPEYGGALLELRRFTTADTKNEVINQLGSIALLDGNAIPPRKVNIDYYYQQGLMPK